MVEGAVDAFVTPAAPASTSAPLRPAHTALAVAVGVPVALAVSLRLEPPAWAAVAGAGAFVLVWLAAIDLEVRLVPNRIVVPATAVVLGAALALDPARGGGHAAAALAAGAALLLAAAVRPGGLGMGDVKLAALLGALLGADVTTALVLGFLLVAVVGLARVAVRGRAALADQLPLAPFLAAGAILTLLLG